MNYASEFKLQRFPFHNQFSGVGLVLSVGFLPCLARLQDSLEVGCGMGSGEKD